MLKLTQDANFLTQVPYILFRFPMLRDELHGDGESGVLTPRFVDLPERPLADVLKHDVVI